MQSASELRGRGQLCRHALQLAEQLLLLPGEGEADLPGGLLLDQHPQHAVRQLGLLPLGLRERGARVSLLLLHGVDLLGDGVQPAAVRLVLGLLRRHARLQRLEADQRHRDELGWVGVVGHGLLPQPGVNATGRLGQIVLEVGLGESNL